MAKYKEHTHQLWRKKVSLARFRPSLLLLRTDWFVADEIFLRAELRYRRHLFEYRNRVIEIEF